MNYSEMAEGKPSYELEDHSWFPDSLRAYQTDFLGGIAKLIGLYSPAKVFLSGKVKSGDHLVDLASGSGIPAILATRDLGVSLTLTDKFPNAKNAKFIAESFSAEYLFESIDIIESAIPPGDVYTMFNSLHHFSKENLIILLKKIEANNADAYFFEPIIPTFLTFLKVGLSTLILPFFMTPFIKPFRWDRLVFTYLFPIGILATFWDGMISVRKSYSLKELENMKTEFQNIGIKISVGQLDGSFANLTYLRLSK